MREFAATATILGIRHRRVGAWSRVGGDAIDLALLAAAVRSKRADARRLAAAAGLVGAILALDLYTAIRLSAAEGAWVTDGSESTGIGAQHDTGGSSGRVRTAITVMGDLDAIRRAFGEFAWQAFDPAQLEAAGQVTFVPAPGDRGVEVHLDHDPGNSVLRKLTGSSPDQKINDDLRRFKAVIETGVEPRSDKTPGGHSARGQIMQRPAQPVEA